MPRSATIVVLAVFAAAGASCHGGDGASSEAQPTCPIPADVSGWIAYAGLRTTAQSDIYLAPQDGHCEIRISTATVNDLLPSWSAARQLVVYASTRDGLRVLVVHDLATASERILDLGALGASDPALSPDGTRIAFEGAVGTATPEVYVVPVAGGDPVNVSSSAAIDTGPAWAPDGASLYFVSTRSRQYDVWRVGVDGMDPVQVTSGSRILGRPAVSPDGRYLAYAAPSATTQDTRVIRRDLSTGAETVLSDQYDAEPAFDASGTRLAVATRRSGSSRIVVLDAATGALLSTATPGAGSSGNPAFPR